MEEKTGICITVPADTDWDEYKKEIRACEDWSHEMNFRVGSIPTRVKPGDRCYLCYRGRIVGWMEITSMGEKSFRCTTTGREWETGKYISRSGPFHAIEPVPQKGFQGYRYVTYRK